LQEAISLITIAAILVGLWLCVANADSIWALYLEIKKGIADGIHLSVSH